MMNRTMTTIKEFTQRYEWLVVSLFALVFIIIRLPAINFPLHQDEYKWPKIVNPALHSETEIPHPPLSQFIYRTAGEIVGFDVHFRLVPLFFGTVNLFLLYYFLRERFGRRGALFAVGVWTLSFFSVLASLMVDTDGEILPFFFLLTLIFYDKTRKADEKKFYYIAALLISIILGAFIKVSFLLVPCALVLDFLWDRKDSINKKQVFVYILYGASFLALFTVLLFLAQKLFPFFSLSKSLSYWEHFWNTDRGWFQTAIQTVKAIFYMSPFLFIPLFGTKQDLRDTKVFYIFIAIAFLFYTVLFDFSLGALDRYFQFLILPVSVIAGVVLSRISYTSEGRYKEYIYGGIIIASLVFLLQALPQFVPPLHPKTEWIQRVFSLRWNFLYPFSGGSGPLGFYVSFLFIAVSWVLSLVLVFLRYVQPHRKGMLLILTTCLAVGYNVAFASEYMFGFWNGSAPRLLTKAITYIQNNPDIQKVTTYNDNGGDELQEIGKYRKRLYTDPKFDINEKIKTLNTYKEHYFVLDVPRIDPTSVYQKYFNSCKVIYTDTDKSIHAIVYDCRGIPDISL